MVYKYRRKGHSMATRSFSDRKSASVHLGKTEGGKDKIYASLQEARSEFTHSRLRYAFMIYLSSGWKFFILVILVISYILDTLLYTFCDPPRPYGLVALLVSFNLMFTVDVCFLIGLKFFSKWRKTLNLVEPETARVFFEGIIAFPYSVLYFFTFHTTRGIDIYAIVPIASISRIHRVVEYFYTKSSQAGCNQWTTFLFQYLTLFLLAVHTWSCIWYLFAYREFSFIEVRSWSETAIHLSTESKFDWYFVCAYFSIMFLTTCALGDLFPQTTIERISGIIAIMLGFILTTIVFVGSLTSQFITLTTRRSKYVRQLQKIQNHLELINMDKETAKRVIRYYEDLWYQKSGVFKPQLMELLPCPLQMEISYDLNAVPLFSSLIFRKLPESFLRRLSLSMSHQFYLPGDIVYSHTLNKTLMICITKGVLELLSDEDDESPMISFGKGTCFGEISLVLNIPARCTVKAATYAECQVLEKKEFIKLMITYPDIVSAAQNEIYDRIARARFRDVDKANKDTVALNIYASQAQKKSSIKCLKDKLRYLQGKYDKDPLTINDHLDEKCLDLYIYSDHIKKRQTKFTVITEKFPWILECDCSLVIYWENFMLLIVFYICVVYPYYIGIERQFPGGFFFYAETVITISLAANLLLSCCTAIKTKKKYIRQVRTIVEYRLNTLGFYLDVIAIIPFEYLVTIHTIAGFYDGPRDHLFYLCKGVKLCLVWRISSFFEKLEKKLTLNTIWIKIAKYSVYILLLCYWCGIILYMEACFVARCSENSWFNIAISLQSRMSTASKTQYPAISAVYFATTLLLSVGYGDFPPGDEYDMGLVAFLSLYGLLLIGYCVAEFSAVITHWSRTKTAFLEILITINKFMIQNNMHPAIKSRIMAFYELQWQYNSGVELTGDSWLEKTVVPSELRKKVLHQARFKTLTSIKFFQVKNKAFIHTLTEMVQDIILPPNEIVYYGGTVSRELYIIESGYCRVTTRMHDKKAEKIIGPGRHMGLLVLLYGIPSPSSVITMTHCKLVVVGHAAYTSALSLYPDMREHDGLLKPEELLLAEQEAKKLNADSPALFCYRTQETPIKSRKDFITGLLQQFLDNSFINLLKVYNKGNETYIQSYQQFKILRSIAPYILLPYVIRPDGIFLKGWCLIRVFTALCLCLIIPVNISMAPLFKSFNEVILLLEIICYLDLYIRLHVAYYGPMNQLIYHPYMTAKNYLTGAFTVDFVLCFPWYMIWIFFVPQHDEGHTPYDHSKNHHFFHCMVRMISVLQIYKLYSAFWAQSLKALKRAYFTSVVQFLLLTIFFLNLYTTMLITMSCVYVSASNPSEFTDRLIHIQTNKWPFMKAKYAPEGNMICKIDSWIDKGEVRDPVLTPAKVYLLALYWTAGSFSGAGFGDFTAQDTIHLVLSICVNVHGVFFFGYVYAKIASLKAVADQVTTKFQENIKHLDMFMNREKVPASLKKLVLDYWKYQWKRTGGWSHQCILGKLHANLNEDAVLFMYERTLREIPLFEGVEYSFFRAFAKKLTEKYFQKGYMVIRSNEVISDMFIIYRGKVDIISEINEVEACMGPGGIFGNIRGATKYLTMSNIVASRNIDLLCIDGPDFYVLLKSFPAVLNKVTSCIATAEKDFFIPTVSADTTSNEVVHLPEEMIEEEEDDRDEFKVFGYPNAVLDSPDKSLVESHGSRSIVSASNVDFVAASWLLFLPHKWFRSSVVPDSKLVCFVEYLIIVISYVDFMVLVYQMAFQSNENFFYICVVFDALFLYKTFLDIHTGYMNRYGDYVLDPVRVRRKYFSKVLHRRRDFLSNFTICYLCFAFKRMRPNMVMNLFCYTRSPQLVRITYLLTIRTHNKMNISSGNLFIKLSTIGIWASILSHVIACLFFKMSCMTPLQCTVKNWMMKPDLHLKSHYFEGNYFAIYTAALWYITNLLTITGTGDVTAQNDFEVVETIIIMIVIKFCVGLLISEMSALITAHSSSQIAYDYGINEMRDGLRDMGLSAHQMAKMWDYVVRLWNRQQGRQMPDLVHELPFRLRCQVMTAVFGSHIRDSVIFSRTDDDFRRMLAMWMRHCVFFPGNYIVQCGDSDQCIYFVHRGEVEVLTVHPNLTESIYDVLGPEDSFGITQGLFVGVPHHFSFRARTIVDIVYLKLDQWKYLLDFYPNAAKVVQRKVETVYLASV